MTQSNRATKGKGNRMQDGTWDDNPPCQDLPGFLQEGEDPHWGQTPEAQAAQAVCRNYCPIRTRLACAKAAQEAGTPVTDDSRTYPASGVVMAGVICTGDTRTARALRQVIESIAPERRCIRCHQPMFTKPPTYLDRADINPKLVIHGGQGACRTCFKSMQRAGRKTA